MTTANVSAKYHWADTKSNGWSCSAADGLAAAPKAQQIANRVRERVYGEGAVSTVEESKFYGFVRAACLEAMLLDVSEQWDHEQEDSEQ